MEAFVHDDGIIGIMLSHYMRQLSTNEYLIFSALYHRKRINLVPSCSHSASHLTAANIVAAPDIIKETDKRDDHELI